jgi:hypothetical protein
MTNHSPGISDNLPGRWLQVPLILALIILSGCPKDKATDLFDSVNGSNVQRLANLYCVYQAAHDFKGPKDEQQFRQFISEMPESRLKYYSVDTSQLDQLFVSERDQKPFIIRWELKAKSRQGLVPLVFEQQGVDGKYMIGFSSFEVREVDRAEYDLYLNGKRDGEVPPDERGDPRGRK